MLIRAHRQVRLPHGGAMYAKSKSETPIGDSLPKTPTRSEVRQLLSVSEGSLHRAKEITRKGTPALIALADESKVSLAGAADVAQEEPSVQNEWAEQVRQGLKPPKPRSTPAKRPKSPPKYGGGRKRHAQVIESIITALEGLSIAADEITELDHTVTSEEAARLAQWKRAVSSRPRITPPR